MNWYSNQKHLNIKMELLDIGSGTRIAEKSLLKNMRDKKRWDVYTKNNAF